MVQKLSSMKRYYGCDAHKKYSIFTWIDERGEGGFYFKVLNCREELRDYLSSWPQASVIALETVGNWYWLVDEIEKAGHRPVLANAAKARAMMVGGNKREKLEARGLAILLRNGTLPSVWIPSGKLRDLREVVRTRMALVRMRTAIKNRIQATLSKYNLRLNGISDIFSSEVRQILEGLLCELPSHTRECLRKELKVLDGVQAQIKKIEEEIRSIAEESEEIRLLQTIPGVGVILAMVEALEIGDVNRFSGPEKLASYSGTVPRVKASGGKIFHGPVRSDVNRYLKWAFVEAANTVVIFHKKLGLQTCHQVIFEIKGQKRARESSGGCSSAPG
jgi:transposase